MIEFLFLFNICLNIVNMFLCISILKTQSDIEDLTLDIERNHRRLEKLLRRKHG